METRTDELYMRRCLELAGCGLGNVAPNPMVGCVIVHGGQIIGEGYHQEYGKEHAEVNAVNAVKNKSLLPESTVYVSLEPCSHYGKTPPCTDLLIKHRVKEVIIGDTDPNPRVAGTGIEKLRQIGIQVKAGLLANEARQLNKRFYTFHEKKRPWVMLKWAQSADGYVDKDRAPGDKIGPNWITDEISRALVHRWRSEEQAIMVGTQTVVMDNPTLNVREWSGKSPLRIVPDYKHRLDKACNIFNKESKTCIINDTDEYDDGHLTWIKIDKKNMLTGLMEFLYKNEIQSLMIEGGTRLLSSFIYSGLWDEARVFTGNKHFISGVKSPLINMLPDFSEYIRDNRLDVYINQS